ncbi:MAG: tetratricopeptide repeat protein, partial [Methylophilaceae bacterium]|nr:tetratricopeptide repeat protein [Methylophilaceae bacterium]
MASSFSNKQPSQQELEGLINLLNQGQLQATANMAQSMLRNYPNTFMIHNLLGIALDGLGDHQTAIESYKRAVQLQSNNPDLHFNLGIALANVGRYEEAINSYRSAIRLQPKFFEAYGNLGTVLQKQGKLEEAVASYRKALSIQADPRGYFNLGTALRDEGKLDEAIKSYRQAIAMFPNYADAHCNLGETLRDQGNMQEAIKSYQDTLAINPNHPQANYDMAEFLYLAKKYDEAIPHFARSQIDDWQERSMYCLYKAERFDEFKQKLDEIVKTTKHTAPFLGTLSTHYATNFGVENPYNFCKNGFDFVYNEPIPELSEPNSPLLKQLLHDIETTEIAARAQGMLHNGKQSAGNLFKRPEASFRTLGELVKKEFAKYREKFQGADCELIQS